MQTAENGSGLTGPGVPDHIRERPRALMDSRSDASTNLGAPGGFRHLVPVWPFTLQFCIMCSAMSGKEKQHNGNTTYVCGSITRHLKKKKTPPPTGGGQEQDINDSTYVDGMEEPTMAMRQI